MSDQVSIPKPRNTSIGLVRAAEFTEGTSLPADTEVLIVGAGIMGTMCAWYLAKRGVSVTVCEKGEVGCEASSRAFGVISELLTDPAKLPLTREAKRLWEDVHAECGETGFRKYGMMYLADSAEELSFYEEWLASVKDIGDSETCILSADEVSAKLPGAARSFEGAIFCPSDGSAEPVLATTAVAHRAARLGVKFVTGCAVNGLEVQEGNVIGAHTEQGYIRARSVVCAANVWSRLFCGNHSIEVPQLYAIMSMGRTGNVEGPSGAGGQEAWAWRKQIDGGYSLGRVAGVRVPATRDALKLYSRFKPLIEMLGSAKVSFGKDMWNDLRLRRKWDSEGAGAPFQRVRMLSGTELTRVAHESLALNAEVFPEMRNTGIDETWSGPLTLTPDNMPIVSPVDQLPGFFLLTGCSFGITWAPALGKLMADMVMGQETSLDPHPFRLSRFTDGSELRITH